MSQKILFQILGLFSFCSLFGQQINGVIYYQNSGGKIAANIEVNAFGCSGVYTNSNGLFILPCTGKKVGQKVKLIIGPENAQGKNIEVVNIRQLEWLRLSDNPNDNPIEIIICHAGQRNKAALRFYGILEQVNNKEYATKLANIEAKLAQTTLEAKERRILLAQIDDLKKQRDEAQEQLEEQAQFIASINQDKASDLVKSAIQKIDQGNDIEAALFILDDAKLEEAYQLALESKVKAEAEIQQVIEGYELKISLLMPKFRYQAASLCYQRIIQIYENNNFDKEELAVWYTKAADVIYDDGKYEKALEYQQKDIDVCEENLDPKHPDLATSYNNIAITYQALGQYEKALQFQVKSIDIREETLASRHPDLATSYNNIALTYQALGKYEKALEYQLKDIDISEKNLDLKHPDLATSYSNIGNTYQLLGQFEKALQYQVKSIDIRKEILDPIHPELATSYNNIGNTYKALGQFEKALVYLQKSIDIREESLGPKHPFLATSYSNIGNIYKALEQYEKALMFQQKSIDIQKEVLDPMHPNLATSYHNIAFTYQALGQFEKTLVFQQKSIAIWKESLGPKHPDLGLSYWNTAITYKEIKEFEKAIALQEKCMAIFKTALPKDHPYQQRTFNTWLEIYHAKASDALERKKYVSALECFDTLNQYVNNGNLWNYTGLCHYYLSNYPKAIIAYQKAVAILPDLRQQYYYNNIGLAYAKNKQYKEAYDAFTEYEKLVPNEGRPFRNWAMYYALQGDTTKALQNLQKAIDLGYVDLEWLKTDDSMDALRKEPLFIEIIEKLEKAMNK